MYRSHFFFRLGAPYIPYFFPTMIHIIATSSKVNMEYIIISDIKELAMIGADVNGNGTTSSAPPTEIIWDEGLRAEGWLEGAVHDELFIGGVEYLLHYAKRLLALSSTVILEDEHFSPVNLIVLKIKSLAPVY